MKLSQVMKDLKANIDGELLDIEVEGITVDSRRIRDNWVFVCIDGTDVDGHKFAKQAEEKGALLVVCERKTEAKNQVVVEDTREVWAKMCANWFGNPAEKLKLIGVTGTNGKTSVTYFLKSVLECCGYKAGLIGTIQNMIGKRSLPATQTTPDAYHLQSLFALMVAEGCSYVVMEVSSHALDQNRVGGLIFDAGVFTNFSQDHLDYHDTMENYLEAKKKLFKSSKKAIVNLDDEWEEKLVEGLKIPIVTFSASKDEADYTAKNIVPRSDGVNFELVSMHGIGRIRLPIPGMFSVYNALATAACAIELGLDFDQVTKALSDVKGIKGRVEVVPTPNQDFTVIIDYAHTPDSLAKVCETLKKSSKGRLVTLFGCGGDRDKKKRPLMAKATTQYSDYIIVTSDNPRSEDPEKIIDDIVVGFDGITFAKFDYKIIVDRREAIKWAIDNAQPRDIILLAGKGHETYQILRDGTISLDEREVVAHALKEV